MADEVLTSTSEMVDGLYRLGTPIKYSAAGSILETEFGPEALPAVIKIRERDAEDSDAAAERWRNALELEHPNLLRVYATGSAILNGVSIVYVVMERADESLQNVLADRALTVEETRRMLVPALAALKYLHNKDYKHSHLVPSNVLAVGEQLKLSSDSVVRLNDDESPAEDIRALGILMVQALSQKMPRTDGSTELAGLKVPPSLAAIVRHCLDPEPARRWTAEQVEAELNAPQMRPFLVEHAVVAEAEPVASQEEVPAEPHAQTETPVEEYESERSPHPIPKWVYATVAALAMIAVLAVVTRKKDPPPGTPATSVVVTPANPVATPQAPVREEPAPQGSKPSASGPPQENPPAVASIPTPSLPAARTPRAGGRNADGWSVIVAAYNSREAAEKRRVALAKKWPNFHVAISEPPSEKTRYVVTLGQDLSQDKAEALRKRAVEAGLPRDTYIKRLM